ncbi:hypothetical protein KI387_040496, partial [Taxus chinensis]
MKKALGVMKYHSDFSSPSTMEIQHVDSTWDEHQECNLLGLEEQFTHDDTFPTLDVELSFDNPRLVMNVETSSDSSNTVCDNHKVWDPGEVLRHETIVLSNNKLDFQLAEIFNSASHLEEVTSMHRRSLDEKHRNNREALHHHDKDYFQ